MYPYQKTLNIRMNRKASPAAHGTFPASIIPEVTYKGEELYQAFADYMGNHNTYQAKQMISALESFIMEELKAGHRLDFGLVSFFPKLSKALPTIDANPSEEGIYVRGAVKGKRPLAASLASKLIAVNPQAKRRSVITNVDDTEARMRTHGFHLGHIVDIFGKYISIRAEYEDEKVWLEKPVKHRSQKHIPLAYGEKLGTDDASNQVQCRFAKGAVKPGTYMLCIATRGGDGLDHTLRTVRHQIKVMD